MSSENPTAQGLSPEERHKRSAACLEEIEDALKRHSCVLIAERRQVMRPLSPGEDIYWHIRTWHIAPEELTPANAATLEADAPDEA